HQLRNCRAHCPPFMILAAPTPKRPRPLPPVHDPEGFSRGPMENPSGSWKYLWWASADVGIAGEFQAPPPQFGPGGRVISLRRGPSLVGAVVELAGDPGKRGIADQSARRGDPGLEAVDVVADLLEHYLGGHVGGRVQAVDRDLGGGNP